MRRINVILFGGSPGLYFSTDAVSITPTLGAELLANGAFSAWTGDNPDGWTVTGESGSDPEVTERDSGQGHADTKTTGGSCNLYSSATANNPQVNQVVLTVGVFYQMVVALSKVTGGILGVYTGNETKTLTSAAIHTFTRAAVGTTFRLRALGTPPYDYTVDSASVRALTGTEQLFTHAVPYGDFSAALTMADTLYQGGVVFNWGNANNFMRLYLDRVNGKVYLVKRVSGTTTTVGSWSATYSAGATLTARRHKDGTIDVIYNGVTLASGIAATGLTGQQAGPFLTDASGVTISRYAWDARSIT